MQTFIVLCLKKNFIFRYLPKNLVKVVVLLSSSKKYIKSLIHSENYSLLSYCRGFNVLVKTYDEYEITKSGRRFVKRYYYDYVEYCFVVRDLGKDKKLRNHIFIQELRTCAVQQKNMEALKFLYKAAPPFCCGPLLLAIKTNFLEFVEFCAKNKFYKDEFTFRNN